MQLPLLNWFKRSRIVYIAWTNCNDWIEFWMESFLRTGFFFLSFQKCYSWRKSLSSEWLLIWFGRYRQIEWLVKNGRGKVVWPFVCRKQAWKFSDDVCLLLSTLCTRIAIKANDSTIVDSVDVVALVLVGWDQKCNHFRHNLRKMADTFF